MSTLIMAKDLRRQDLFELPNGSVYAAAGNGDPAGTPRARLWCAHPPDRVTPDPPLIDLPPSQEVRLLTGDEVNAHYAHDGFVERAFGQEMDRRNGAMMRAQYERTQQEGAARRQTQRPWWRKRF